MNFVCLVFELGDKTLTLSPMENLMVKCNLKVFLKTLAAEENHVMVRHNLSSYTVPFYHPFTRNYY